jgi:sulfotransferase
MLCATLQQRMSGGTEFRTFFDDERRRSILRGLFAAYYRDTSEGEVVFDTNRNWTGKMALLAQLYPDCRLICCVREIGWIIDSLEKIQNENPTQFSRIFGNKPLSSVYARADGYMKHENGLIGQPWCTLREAWFGSEAKRLIVVPYERLAKDPAAVMQRLYQELKEPAFKHDFTNLAYDEPEYDYELGLPGLHKVRPKVATQVREKMIPPDLFAKYADASFWLRPELNTRGVAVL